MFKSLEFVMTMGADTFQQFVFSYFVSLGLAVTMRTYVGPLVERLELFAQRVAIKLSKRFKFVEGLFKNVLRRQLK
jgi:hypothetical protein